MSLWNESELGRVSRASELEISSRRPDGSLRPYVVIWAVRVGDDLYVRSAHGYENPWFQRALGSGAGRIRAGGVEREVSFEVPGPEVAADVTGGVPREVRPLRAGDRRDCRLRRSCPLDAPRRSGLIPGPLPTAVSSGAAGYRPNPGTPKPPIGILSPSADRPDRLGSGVRVGRAIGGHAFGQSVRAPARTRRDGDGMARLGSSVRLCALAALSMLIIAVACASAAATPSPARGAPASAPPADAPRPARLGAERRRLHGTAVERPSVRRSGRPDARAGDRGRTGRQPGLDRGQRPTGRVRHVRLPRPGR